MAGCFHFVFYLDSNMSKLNILNGVSTYLVGRIEVLS